jgi:hypothetical protein
MEIKYGEIYVNKTWRFLAPSLKYFGQNFTKRFNVVSKLAVGIHDTATDGSDLAQNNVIYTLVDRKANPFAYEELMDFLQYEPYYIDSYSCDEVVGGRKMMIVLRLPEAADKAYKYFLQGRYSLMYSEEELQVLFSRVVNKEARLQQAYTDYEILTKTGTNAKNLFVKNILKEFGKYTKIDELVLDEIEWELPLKKQEEIFNYKSGDTIFFNDKVDKTWN